MKVGIIQPGRLGDILICLPIAKYYHDQGHEVYWPIFHNYFEMIKDVVDYAHFTPTTNDVYTCVYEARINLAKCDTLLDLAATFPGSNVTEQYVAEGDGFGKEKFDQFKYKIANVPFEEKWNLSYKRNIQKEQEVYDKYVKADKYDIFSLKHSRGKVNKTIQSKYQLIEMNEDHSIFDWRMVLEKAQHICLVDSAISNFVEQINTTNKKVLIIKQGQPTATYKNWSILNE